MSAAERLVDDDGQRDFPPETTAAQDAGFDLDESNIYVQELKKVSTSLIPE